MPVSASVQKTREERYARRRAAAEEVVPHGPYCYRPLGGLEPVTLPDGSSTMRMPVRRCPFWKLRKDKPAQQNGYCRFLEAGDFSHPRAQTMLLWDQVKECDINLDDDCAEEV